MKILLLGCLVGFLLSTIIPIVLNTTRSHSAPQSSSHVQQDTTAALRASGKDDDAIEAEQQNSDLGRIGAPELLNRIQNLTRESIERKKKIKVFCWVPSRSARGPVLDRIIDTWANSCDKLIFTSTSSNPQLNVVKINYPLTDSLWNMIHPAWNYIDENYLDEYDWFVKVDDDSFFSGDNFKSLVKDMKPDDRYYLGHTAYSMIAPKNPRGAFNLGAGHALSSGSLRWLGPFLPDSKKPLPPGFKQKCARTISWAEDIELNECLWVAGIGGPNESRDSWGRQSFMGFPPLDNFYTVRRPDSSSWFWVGKPNNTGSGASCCSSRPILWHGLKDGCQGCHYYINYFLYDVAVDPILKG